MIAADTSSLIAYLTGAAGPDIDPIEAALAGGELALPPVVVTELTSDPAAGRALETRLSGIRLLEPGPGYWIRAGQSRRNLLQRGFRAKVADALVAQACIDHDVALVTRDRDFRHFAVYCGLRLVLPG